MSEGNLEQVLRGYDRWNHGDFAGALEFIHPDVEWRPGALLVDVDELYEGHDGVLRFWDEFMTPFESIAIEPIRHVTGGDEVVIQAHFQARGRGGVTGKIEVFHHYTLRDGKLIRFQAYPGWEEALAGAGLDPGSLG
jgi:ketosteroid isomerase-like protein